MSATLPVRAAAVVSAVLLAAACSGGGQTAQPGGKADVRVLLDWFPNPDHVALYTALDKGLFTEANLAVTLTPPANPADPLKLVAAKQVELGISYQPDVLMAAEQDLFHDVIEWKLAVVKLREAQGALAIECDFTAALDCCP